MNFDSPNYAFVRATYRTIANLKKGLIDRRIPQTFDLIRKLSTNKKVNNFHLTEHLKNVNSLHRRLTRIGQVILIVYSLNFHIMVIR